MKWKRLFITLAVGSAPTLISFALGWWWVGTIFALITLFTAFFAFPTKLYPVVFTLYTVIALAWISAALLDSIVPGDWAIGNEWRIAALVIVGTIGGAIVPAVFWFMIFSVSVTFMLALSKSLDISWWQAFKYVARRTFELTQPFVKVEEGKVAFENTKGMLSNFGGPGILVIAPGNAAVLEWGGRIARIVGPGIHPLRKFETFWKPIETKGVVDLRPQFKTGVAEDVRTKDGIRLNIKVGCAYQLEPKHVTDEKPGSHFAGGDATTPVIGAPEFPVYEAIIKKSLYNVPKGGWKDGWFPDDPINVLRDIVVTYTLDQIFEFDRIEQRFTPAQRVIKAIEEEVKERYDPSGGGVCFKGFDIREIGMPEDVEAQVRKKWRARVERELKIEEAKADRELRIEEAKVEREGMLARSEVRVQTLARLEKVRLEAREQTAKLMDTIVKAVGKIEKESVAWSFISAVQELTNRVGQDETVALRYIEAMQTVMESPGPKSFVITPPNPSPGGLPSPPQPTLPQVRMTQGNKEKT